jgi:mannose-1-phosphate guanylyltransferase
MDRPLVAVVLAGGIGSRLYPASRSDRPKQFLALDGDRSLLTRTVERASFADRILVVTREAHVQQAREHVAEAFDSVATASPHPPTEVVAEPAGRDTGPALLYGTHLARERESDPVVLALPSDHHVEGEFAPVGRRAARAAVETDALATVGITPTRPETGYGYVEPGADHDWYREVVAFHEKPDAETAAAYVDAGHLWNAGIFAWTPEALFREARDSPLAALAAALAADDPTRGFRRVESLSVDYAIMERAEEVVVVPADLEWDDLGAWDALARIREADADGNVTLGESLAIDASDNVVVSDDAHVSLVGVEGLAVVAWDDRVLVVPTEQAQRVREVVDRLRASDQF